MLNALIDEFAQQLGAAELRQTVHFGHGTDNPHDEAAMLVGGYLRKVGRVAANAADITELRGLLQRRIEERIPVAYLTGEGWFAGHRFEIAPGVMIPRSPLAELIESKFAPWLRRDPASILDLCCGSGCIGIAAALAFPGASLTLVDIDDLALANASRNVRTHGLMERARVIRSSLFEALAGERFDLVLSNPPYVDAADLASMPDEFRHEPMSGLTGGQDGLDLWRDILDRLPGHLAQGGLLAGEVGNSASALEAAFELPFIWPELLNSTRLDNGTFGVFLLEAQALV